MDKDTQELLRSLADLNREIGKLQEICAIVNTRHSQVLESLGDLTPALMLVAEKSSASAATRSQTITAIRNAAGRSLTAIAKSASEAAAEATASAAAALAVTVAAAARHAGALAKAASTRSQRGTPPAAGVARRPENLAHATFGFVK
jgi:hypothetical protein